MLQIVTELDGFDARGNIKVLMATNRPDTLDPALLRPGRLDRKVEVRELASACWWPCLIELNTSVTDQHLATFAHLCVSARRSLGSRIWTE